MTIEYIFEIIEHVALIFFLIYASRNQCPYNSYPSFSKSKSNFNPKKLIKKELNLPNYGDQVKIISMYC